jgi:hypothetical protein
VCNFVGSLLQESPPYFVMSATDTIFSSFLSDIVDTEVHSKALRDTSSTAAVELLDTKLRSILEDVRLVYLLEREGGWDTTTNWEDILSLGEQQRLGMVSVAVVIFLYQLFYRCGLSSSCPEVHILGCG